MLRTVVEIDREKADLLLTVFTAFVEPSAKKICPMKEVLV